MSATEEDHVEARIRRTLVRALSLEVREEEISLAESLDAVVGLDSLAVLEFVDALEKEFALVIEPEQLELERLRDLAGPGRRRRRRACRPRGRPSRCPPRPGRRRAARR